MQNWIKRNAFKILGGIALIAGLIGDQLSEYVNEKKTEELIDKKIAEALAAANDEES